MTDPEYFQKHQSYSITPGAVAIVGAGSIGVAFAIVFARAGWTVNVYDPDESRRKAALLEIDQRLNLLRSYKLLPEAPDAVATRIQMLHRMKEAVQFAELVIECAPERLDLKRDIFKQLDEYCKLETILCSASSALCISSFCSDLPSRQRCLIAHPGNPPYLISIVEIVPADFTGRDIVERSRSLFSNIGMQPILVRREVEGFVFNRLQGAVLREAYCLVRDGVADVADIDTVIRDGLGYRWSIAGPFETVDLNTRGGIISHAEKMGPAYARMGAERGQVDPWTPELVATVAAQRRATLPLEEWDHRVEWRDGRLMTLAKHRSDESESEECSY